MKKKVKMRWRPKSCLCDPKVMFAHLPYILDAFDFEDTDDFDYYMYYNAQQTPPSDIKATKIFWSREYLTMQMEKHDWALGWQHTVPIKSDRYFRYPNYVFYGAGENLIKPANYDPEKIAAQKTKFCAYVCRHKVNYRNAFFDALSKYKFVHSPSACRNNCPPIGPFSSPRIPLRCDGVFTEQLEYYKQFKFVICFQNKIFEGYTSERIYFAMLANCIPIFCGNPYVGLDFNPKSFVNAHAFDPDAHPSSFPKIVEYIRYLDNNKHAYLKMLSEPWYHNNKLNRYVDPNNVLAFFTRMFSGE